MLNREFSDNIMSQTHIQGGPGGSNSMSQLDYLTTHTSLSPIWRGLAPGFVNYNKGCTRLAAASDKVYQLLAHGRWFSLGTLASSTTKTGRHDIVEILLKVALNTINQSVNKSTKATYRTSQDNDGHVSSQQTLSNKQVNFKISLQRPEVLGLNCKL